MINKLRQYRHAVIISTLFTTLASMAGIFRFDHYVSATFDLGCFTEMVKTTLQGIKGSSGMLLYDRTEGFSHFAIHFSPVMFIVVPFYAIWHSPITLLIVQAIMVGIGGFLIYYLAFNVFKLSKKVSIIVLLAYVLNPLVWSLLVFDFHELAFAVPFVMLMIIGYFKKNNWLFLIGLGLSLCVKEDVIATVGLLGVSLIAIEWLKTKKFRLNGYAVTMIIAAVIGICVAVLVSWKASDDQVPQILNSIIQRYTDSEMIKKPTLLSTGIWYIRYVFDSYSIGQFIAYFAPLCFLPFFSIEWGIPACFVLLIAMVSTWGGQHNYINQYGMTAVPYLFTATIVTLSKKGKEWDIQKNIKWMAIGGCIAMAVLYLLTNLTGINELIAPNFNKMTKEADSSLNQIIKDIPKGESITVTGNNLVLPHLVSNWDAYEAPTQFGTVKSIYGYPQTNTDYVITDTNTLISQNYRATLTGPIVYNWDIEMAKELGESNNYQLVNTVGNVDLWKLK